MRSKRASPVALLLGAFAVMVGLTILVGTPSATASHAAVQANSVTFQDSTGEDANALDIGTVTVSNDDTGLVTFDVKFVNGSPSSARDEFYVVMNTDRDESTGSPNGSGADYLIEWWGPAALAEVERVRLGLRSVDEDARHVGSAK